MYIAERFHEAVYIKWLIWKVGQGITEEIWFWLECIIRYTVPRHYKKYLTRICMAIYEFYRPNLWNSSEKWLRGWLYTSWTSRYSTCMSQCYHIRANDRSTFRNYFVPWTYISIQAILILVRSNIYSLLSTIISLKLYRIFWKWFSRSRQFSQIKEKSQTQLFWFPFIGALAEV